jgi:hypothetical protein
MYYFNTAFPTKTSYVNNNKNKWLTKGLILSRNAMRFFNRIKIYTNLSLESLHYINRYQLIYKEHAKKLERRIMTDSFYPLKIKPR